MTTESHRTGWARLGEPFRTHGGWLVRAHFTFVLAICALLLWAIVVGANEGAAFPPSRHELTVGFYSLTGWS